MFQFDDLLQLAVHSPTKRQLIQFFASIYDPLGLLNPFVVKLKILFQQVCNRKIAWDSFLTDDLLDTWTLIRNDLLSCSEFVIDRWCNVLKDAVRVEIHGFCDASLRAYGGCVYVRVVDKSGKITSLLLTARSRVAPVKGLTIPKLELVSALLLAELIARVCSEFEGFVNVHGVYCWVDSMVALHWISSVKTISNGFVKRRVDKIRSLVSVENWYHVDSKNNPADILSRGAFISHLSQNDLWLYGPSFLHKITDFEQYSLNFLNKQATSLLSTVEEENEEIDVVKSCVTLSDVFNVEQYNDFTKLKRVLAYVMRFINNLKNKVNNEPLINDDLRVEEIDYAERILIIDCQKNVEQLRNYKQLRNDLRLFTDEQGVIRCKGRLEHAPLPYESKFPIFIPKCYLATLIIQYYHASVLHDGVKETLNAMRTKFWIPRARAYIRSITYKCRLCKIIDGKTYSYPQAPSLPPSRLSPKPPFSYTGLDYAGPVYVRDIYYSSSITYKAWIFLFTCSSTRAVCLDLVPDYSSPTCVRGLRRFFSRRGVPESILSDNGSNFTATDTQRFATNHGVNWEFNPPASPWWGGIFERMVRSTKRCLKKVLLNAKLSYEELQTVLFEIEMVLNNRPLTFTYEEPGDEVLTPNHLLFGRRLNFQAHSNESNSNNINLSSRFEHIQTVLEHFWRRWRNEYVLELREQHKAINHSINNVCEKDDVVLIHEDKVPRATFKVGIVESFKPSRDNQKRVALVRYINSDGKVSKIYRPINKLYPVEGHVKTKDDIPKIKFIDESKIVTHTTST